NLREIAKRAPSVVEDYHRRLSQRVSQLLSKAELKVNEPELIKEVAVFAERADINEEIQRLTSHLDAFEESCRTGEHAGRELDFIAKEGHGLPNSTSNTANEANIDRQIVGLKGGANRPTEKGQEGG